MPMPILMQPCKRGRGMERKQKLWIRRKGREELLLRQHKEGAEHMRDQLERESLVEFGIPKKRRTLGRSPSSHRGCNRWRRPL